MTSDNAERAIGLLRGLSSGDREVATRHVNPHGSVQHDPTVAAGPGGLREQAGRAAGRPEVVRVWRTGLSW